MKNFTDLLVWQKSMDLAEEIYRVTAGFPSEEKFGLIAQSRRAALAVPSNVAEGQGRMTAGEWLQFLGHARGSLNEVKTQLIFSRRLGYLSAEHWQDLSQRFDDVGKALNGLIEFVRNRAHPRRPNNQQLTTNN